MRKTTWTLVQISNEMTSKGKRKMGFYVNNKGQVRTRIMK